VLCAPVPPVSVSSGTTATTSVALSTRICDPDEAYDPTVRCVSPPPAETRRPWQETVSAWQPAPAPAPVPASPINRVAASAALDRSWAVQVGAFSNTAIARIAVDRARAAAPGLLRDAQADLRPTASRGGTLYRARLTRLSEDDATNACASLARSRVDCVVVRSDGERSW
jgi:cell division protein FtsN